MNRFKGMVLGFAFMAVPAIAQAQVINFDDVNGCNFPQLTNGYHGFDWNNFYVLQSANINCSYTASGYVNGLVSSPNVAYNAYGSPAQVSSANPFTFNSVYMTAAWHNGLTVVVTGYLGATQLYQQTFTLNTYAATQFVFNWSGVDKVDFTSYGGTNPGYGGDGTHVAFDDMDLNSNVTPEPATLLLLGSGLTGIGGVIRRRRQKNAEH
jgi:hypothetical protein